MNLQTILNYASSRKEQNLNLLMELLRIPSISTLPEHKTDILDAANWLVKCMSEIGLKNTHLIETGSHPAVYSEWLEAGSKSPTVLIYGHYDVQPVDPVAEWKTPPFSPALENGYIYARGASDDKGQLFLYLAACEAYLKTENTLPINVKFLLEGSEESGSVGLEKAILENKEKLACDAVILSDSGFLDSDTPAITTGVRGMAYFEVEISGPENDLHSGNTGGIVHNPLQVLVELLASLHDGDGKIAIPGIYDSVQELSRQERDELNRIPFNEENTLKNEVKAPALWTGEKGYTALERLGIRPSLTIHGIAGGFVNPGMKTVIPARVTAKVSIRLVPDQDPEVIARLFTQHFHDIAPATVQVTIRTLGTAHPAVIDSSSLFLAKARQAYLNVFGKEPVFMRNGGSIPVVGDFQKILQSPVIMMGFGLPDDGLHAPNERFKLSHFYKGIQTIIHYFNILGEG